MIKELCKQLTKDDLELRVGSCSEKGFSLLLYKTARTDVNRLNNVCGLGWSNSHKVDIKGNVTCSIKVYDKDLGLWVEREDTGSESMTEKEKGSYSDSFKRAGFRFGIGIELYKSPFIWVTGRTKKNAKGKFVPDFFTSNLEITEYDVCNGVPNLTIKLKNDVLFTNVKGKKEIVKVIDKKEVKKEVPTSLAKLTKHMKSDEFKETFDKYLSRFDTKYNLTAQQCNALKEFYENKGA